MTQSSQTRGRGPLTLLLNLFSSIWLGMTLLSLLFIYLAMGSAGVPVRFNILRPDAWQSVREIFELSEFQWFHWWPFDLLIALICITLTVTTIRRIPFGVVNLGVWMIHSGIIILALGSVWYFSTKVEGEAPVARRQVVAQIPGYEPVRFVAAPGNSARVGEGEDEYAMRVQGITPSWELLSGDDAGKRVYKVSVAVQKVSDPSQMFIRELLAGFPEYTEDLIRTDDPQQPFARAKKVNADGEPLVDQQLSLSLEPQPQEYFYLIDSAAIYLRVVEPDESGDLAGARRSPWVERPIQNLPRFKDYISTYDFVWMSPTEDRPPLRPLNVMVPPAEEGDPLPDVTFHISDYLRYAVPSQRRRSGGALNPYINLVAATADGRSQSEELLAFDPQRSSAGGGVLQFHWVDTEEELEPFRELRLPTITFRIPESSIEVEVMAEAQSEFTAIEGTAYTYRILGRDELPDLGLSLVRVEIKHGEDEPFTRWVFDDPTRTRDVGSGQAFDGHQAGQMLDEQLITTYRPGVGWRFHIVAGPRDEDLRLFKPKPDLSGTLESKIEIGTFFQLRDQVGAAVTRYLPRSYVETRPYVAPRAERDPEVGINLAMVRLNIPTGEGTESNWLRFNRYPFESREQALHRFPHNPTIAHLPDGRHVELLFSRERRKLSAPVVLEDFELDTHVGGYEGSTLSILNWTSVLRFLDEDPTGPPRRVSVNNPQEHDGLWYFQAQWDAPDRNSAGLNYTVLGVGNREGVQVQLLGCCLAVIGMIYAFYVKPVIKRRRQAAVYANVPSSRGSTAARVGANGELETVATVMEEQP